MGDNKIMLPPGFEFDPSDEELIVYFLSRRAAGLPCYPNIIPDLDLYAANPWDLTDKAFRSKKEWYFFSRLKQNGRRRKRFWKEVGVSEAIFTGNGDEVGTKKCLVFDGDDHEGGSDTSNWIMEEYHLLSDDSTSHQIQGMREWVVCRVREAKVVDSEEKKMNGDDAAGVELSYLDEVFFSMEDDQEEITFPS